jgi:membrane protein required for beta-lactamase induction
MTPTLRIALLFVAVASLPFLPPAAPLAALAGIAIALPFVSPALRDKILTGTWRLRWLILALVVLFVFFSAAPWTEVAARIAVLVCAVAAVQLALHGVPADALAAGLARVLSPLEWLGVPATRFATRLVATLDAVPEVQALIAATPTPASGTPLARLADRAAAVILQIENVGAAPLRRE